MTGLKPTVVKVIIFSVIGILMTVALGVKLANSRLFADTYVLQAEFENASGVLRGDAVKLAGIDVGRVERAEIEDGKAIVTFNIDKDVRLSEDSIVSLRWRNVLGQRFLYVHPGEGNDYFAEDDRIPVENTEDVSDIGEFLNRLGPILKAIEPEQANAFLDSINTALAGNEVGVRHLLTDGATLARTLSQEDQQIKGLLTSADRIMATYAEQNESIGRIFDDLDIVGEMLARRTDDVNALVTDFAAVQHELDGLLTRNRGNIDATISSLDDVAGNLARNKKNLRETIRTLPLGSSNYFQTSSWGEWFNVRIVTIMMQDQDSEIVFQADEQDNQRGDSGGSPQTGNGAGDGYDKDDDGDDQDPKEGEGARQGIESVLRFTLTGGGS